MMRGGFVGSLAAAVYGVLCLQAAVAQPAGYPSSSIQLIIPYPPGGSEAVGRRIAQTMSKTIGQALVVNNIPGASTQIASMRTKEARPDGYTLYVSSPPDLVMGPAFYEGLSFDPLRDFTLISYYAQAPYLLLVSSKLGAKSYTEFVDKLRRDPKNIRFASYGPLSQVDILARRFKRETGIDFDIVTYRGGGPAFTALLSGEVQAVFATPIPTRGYIDDGSFVPVAVTTEARSKLLPNVPSLKEAGLNIVDSASYGLVGPRGLSPEIAAYWQREWTKAMKDPETAQFLANLGVEVVASSPEYFRTWLVQNTKMWADLATSLGIDKQR